MLLAFAILSILTLSCSKKEQNFDPQKINAAKLKITKIEAKVVSSPKRKVTFSVQKSSEAMYSQFIICTVTKPVRCNPSEKAPGIAREDDYEFLSPPVGDLEIKLRACVEPPYAQSTDRLCGDWKRTTIGTPTMM